MDDKTKLDPMTIAEYPRLSWAQTRGFGDDSSINDCSILKASNMKKGMSQDWTLSLPHDAVNLTLEAVWILVYCYAE